MALGWGSSNRLNPSCWFCVRRNGTAKRSGWLTGVPLDALATHLDVRPDEQIEVCVLGSLRKVSPKRLSRVFYPRVRGIVGMEIHWRGHRARYAPTRMIAGNLSFDRALERFRQRHGIAAREFETYGRLYALSARQYLVDGKGGAPVELFRGSTPIEPAPAPGEDRARDLAEGIGRWMVANLSGEGALPYKYWPSRGEASRADNATRRFLGSLTLARLGELQSGATVRDAAKRNLRFNLKRYFRRLDPGYGAIVERNDAKLGAAAVAALAILESPARDEFAEELDMLAAGIDSLADPVQGFRTFFFPAERDGENWNFYSGEALLFWAEAVRRNLPRAPSMERCVHAFTLCSARHRQSRNPAFVPWHTQACASLFAQTGRRELADFVFEMNDWLLPMQQWDGLEEDLRGRFYDPKHPEFGPPHAASTGVYLEGLADALALALAVGEQSRASAYELAIERGLRSLRQLQFRDHRDLFYVSRKERVLGALRTEAYDNAVRIDSAAHALAAAVKVQQPMRFARHPAPRG